MAKTAADLRMNADIVRAVADRLERQRTVCRREQRELVKGVKP
jgi:hypothetical protein